MAVCYDGISLQNQRKVNMDSLLLKSRALCGTQLCMAAVCDGVGSLSDGAYAASSAVKMLSNWFENLEDTGRLGLRLRDYVDTVNFAIAVKARSLQLKTACTLSCLLLWDGQYAVAHVGDSRIYTMQGDALRQLTLDQARQGRLTASVGHKEKTEIFYTEGTYMPGQPFLVCSDGLYKRLEDRLIGQFMQKLNGRNLKKLLQQMAGHAIAQGEKDNISAAFLISGEG